MDANLAADEDGVIFTSDLVAGESATVEVTAPTTTLASLQATAQVQATAKDAGGNTLAGKTFTWSSSAPFAIAPR